MIINYLTKGLKFKPTQPHAGWPKACKRHTVLRAHDTSDLEAVGSPPCLPPCREGNRTGRRHQTAVVQSGGYLQLRQHLTAVAKNCGSA